MARRPSSKQSNVNCILSRVSLVAYATSCANRGGGGVGPRKYPAADFARAYGRGSARKMNFTRSRRWPLHEHHVAATPSSRDAVAADVLVFGTKLKKGSYQPR